MGHVCRATELFRALSGLFVDDEGSIPELQLEGVRPDEAQTILDRLLALAGPLRADQCVWDLERDGEFSINEYADPARLAAQQRLQAFRVVVRDVRWQGHRLPDIGFSAWPGTVALDFPAGSHWTPDLVAAFIDLVHDLQASAPTSTLLAAYETSEPLPEPRQQHFQHAVERFVTAE